MGYSYHPMFRVAADSSPAPAGPILVAALALNAIACGQNAPPSSPAPVAPAPDASPPAVALPTITDVGDGISTSSDGRILMELRPEDASPARLFDLDGKTLVFTPDGSGGYSRSVRPLAWEDDVAEVVADGTIVEFRGFDFEFAGRRWRRFHVSRDGLVTFGAPLTYRYHEVENRFDTMDEIANKLVTTPTISAMYRPTTHPSGAGPGTARVAHGPDRIVVTWTTGEQPEFFVYGTPPEVPARFQASLGADGSVRFSYMDVSLGDGIVGLFPHGELSRETLIASIPDPVNPELPGHLDLLEMAIFEANTGDLIVDWTLREAIPTPPRGTRYSYRLLFDTDEPYFDGDGDEDFRWRVVVDSDRSWAEGGRRLPTDTGNRITLLVDDPRRWGLAASVWPKTSQHDDGRYVQGDRDTSSAQISLPDAVPATDLSQPGTGLRQGEVFHYREAPDLGELACRAITVLGDIFDLFVFHSEFRVDSQESGSPWSTSESCGEGRLKGHWDRPVWMKSFSVIAGDGSFDAGLVLFAHEFAHAWTAYASYDRGGRAGTSIRRLLPVPLATGSSCAGSVSLGRVRARADIADGPHLLAGDQQRNVPLAAWLPRRRILLA